MKNRFESFLMLINDINRSIQIIKNKEMEEYGLKGIHVMCMYQLMKHSEGLTSKEVAALCGEDKAAISRSLSTLEEKHLIRFEGEDGKKRYRTQIFLTDDGKDICESLDRKIKQMVILNGEGYSEEDRETLYRVLREIASNLRNTSLGTTDDTL